MQLVIGVTGFARSGKDTLSDYLVRSYGFKKFNMSDVISVELMKRGLPITKDNMSKLGDQMRAEFGNNIVLVKTLEKARNFDKVVITGFRSPEEVSDAKFYSQNFFIIGVEANDDMRYGRRSKDDPQPRADFFGRDERDIQNKGLDRVIQNADFIIKNDSTFEDFHRKIDDILKIIIEKIK